MTPADAARLQEAFRRESRSLLQYARSATPHAAGPDRKLLDAVNRIADEEVDAIRALAGVLDATRVTVPPPGAFPMRFTDYNFIGVRTLLPKLVSEQKRDLEALQADAAALTDPAAREVVGRLIELHRRHLAELEALA